jgi:hypothetical protein
VDVVTFVADRANSINESGLFSSTESISSMLDEIALGGLVTSEHRLVSVKDNTTALITQDTLIPWISGSGLMVTPHKINVSGYAGWESKLMGAIENLNCRVAKVKYTGSTGSYEGHTEVIIVYKDGSTAGIASRGGLFTNVYIEGDNPNPEKIVSKIEFRGGNNRTGGGTISFTDATFEFSGTELSFRVGFAQPMTVKEFVAYLDKGILDANSSVTASYSIRSGINTYGPFDFGQKITLPTSAAVDSIQARFDGSFASDTSPITKILLRRVR